MLFAVIGSKGENITQIQAQSGCRIQIAPDPPPGQSANERQVSLNGSAESIAKAKDLINKTINEAGHAGNAGGMGGHDMSGGGGKFELFLTLSSHGIRAVVYQSFLSYRHVIQTFSNTSLFLVFAKKLCYTIDN